MTELLKRWHALEPDRCLIGPPTSHICASVMLGKADFLVPFDRPTPAQVAVLLAAVVEAIEARGWDWNLTSMLPWNATARRYMATVTYHVKEADSDVAALLTAYLAALEAEAGQ